MLEVIIDSRIRVPLFYDAEFVGHAHPLDERIVAELKRAFEHQNPQHARLLKLGLPTATEPEIIQTWQLECQTWQLEEAHLTFPRGGMGRVREILSRDGNPTWRIIDRRELGSKGHSGDKIPDHKVTLYDYQESAVEATIMRQNCLMRAPTGSGKTTSAIAIAARLKLPTLIIVWTGALFDQWLDRIESELGLDRKKIGRIRGPMTKLAPITVAMQQSIAARDPGEKAAIADAFGLVICDEVQRFAARTLFSAVDFLPAKYRIGISADESRKDQKEFLVYDLFGQVASNIAQRELVESGHVLDVQLCVIPTTFEAPWYRIAMMKGGHASRMAFHKLLETMANDEARNKLAFDLVQSETDKNEQIIVLSHRREHCQKFDHLLVTRGIASGLMLGGKEDVVAMRDTIDGLATGRIRAAVGTVQAVGQGLDLPAVGRAVVMTPLASNRQQFGQVRGRVCRTAEGKSGARLYYLWDEKVYGVRHLRLLMRIDPNLSVRDGLHWVSGGIYLKMMAKRRVARDEFGFAKEQDDA